MSIAQLESVEGPVQSCGCTLRNPDVFGCVEDQVAAFAFTDPPGQLFHMCFCAVAGSLSVIRSDSIQYEILPSQKSLSCHQVTSRKSCSVAIRAELSSSLATGVRSQFFCGKTPTLSRHMWPCRKPPIASRKAIVGVKDPLIGRIRTVLGWRDYSLFCRQKYDL